LRTITRKLEISEQTNMRLQKTLSMLKSGGNGGAGLQGSHASLSASIGKGLPPTHSHSLTRHGCVTALSPSLSGESVSVSVKSERTKSAGKSRASSSGEGGLPLYLLSYLMLCWFPPPINISIYIYIYKRRALGISTGQQRVPGAVGLRSPSRPRQDRGGRRNAARTAR
jgi:hypothetical protein